MSNHQTTTEKWTCSDCGRIQWEIVPVECECKEEEMDFEKLNPRIQSYLTHWTLKNPEEFRGKFDKELEDLEGFELLKLANMIFNEDVKPLTHRS